MKVVWSIAGLDPSGGAGLAVDAKVFAALGVHGVCVATAVTAQGLRGCRSFRPLPAAEIMTQIEALGPELAPAAIKIGMLGSAAAARAVARILDGFAAGTRPFVVLDPVLAASAGPDFGGEDLAHAIRDELLPRVDLVTPNGPEAAVFPGGLAPATLLKGGHAEDRGPVVDRLMTGAGALELSGERHPWEVRGTGCALSAAIAAFAARGETLPNAVVAARAYVSRGIRNAHDLGAPRRVLAHAPGPPAARDWPWIGRNLAREPFAGCGPEPLGFYPIVDRAAWVRRLVPLGVRTIQLRIKDLAGTPLRRELAEARTVCDAHGARLFVNDHWREALALGAYGVHLGQEDLPQADLEGLRRAGLRLGVSTHSYEEAARVRAVRPSYVALGPIFPTTLKQMPFAPQGTARVAEWRAQFDVPLVAIGGLTLERAAETLDRGAASIAVVSDLTGHPDPEGRTRAWLAFFKARNHPP